MLLYLGPGGGFAIVVGFLAVLAGTVVGFGALLLQPIAWLVRRWRARRPERRRLFRRVVVLGMDGLDPDLLSEFLAAGDLPHFARLAARGTFRRLATTIPAVSPVAWSSFQTGTNPGKHRMFDFLRRRRHDYGIELASMRIDPPRRRLRLGRVSIPIGRPRVTLHRASRPFWSVLSDYGIHSQVLNVPITFPPERFFGLCLAGMDVPDLRGTMGTFTYFTDDPAVPRRPIGGEVHDVARHGSEIRGRIPGPPDPLDRRPPRELGLDWRLVPDPSGRRARLGTGPERVDLEVGRWTDWVPLDFRAAPGLSVRGMVRFLLVSLEPSFRLYVSPIHVDPLRPVLPIARPILYGVSLALRHGRFPTLGMAEDTWAANHGLVDRERFLEETRTFREAHGRIFEDAVGRDRHGLVAVVYDSPDRVQHMFWDDREVLRELYQDMDRRLGRALEKAGDEALVLVCSDHGFGPFRRQVDLNAWLLEEGWLALDGEPGEAPFEGVDWSRTRAYAMGMGAIHLNVRGREGRGIVEPGDEAERLAGQIATRLAALVDPKDGRRAVHRVHRTRDVYHGPYAGEAPDLLVGFERGWRSAWSQVAGKVGRTVFSDNVLAWQGDHAFDPELVPGVLLANHRLAGETAHIQDLAPTVLDAFGVAAPAWMDGRSLLERPA